MPPAPTLVLRDFAQTDLPAVALAMGDPQVTRYYGLETTHTNARAIAQEQLDWYRTLARDQEGWWQAVVHEGGLIGAVGVYDYDDEADSADLGFWLSPAYWGGCRLRAALRQWLPSAFARLQLHSIVAYVEPDNTASQRLLVACGFQHEGLLRECSKRPQGYVSLHRYSLLSHELAPIRVGKG